MDEMKICKINGIKYKDPTGELRMIMRLTESMINIVHDLYDAWDDSTSINDTTIRHCAMEALRDSLDRLTYCVHKIDNLLDLTMKEVYHAEE